MNRLNNLTYDQSLINYLVNGTFPANIKSKIQQERYSRQYDKFRIVGDKIMLDEKEVILDGDKEEVLQNAYDNYFSW